MEHTLKGADIEPACLTLSGYAVQVCVLWTDDVSELKYWIKWNYTAYTLNN